MVALGDVVAVRSSLVDPTEDKYANLPHIAPDTIERDTGRLLPYMTIGESGVQSGKYRFEAGDVLYSKIRPNLNKVAVINFDGLCSADMYALQVDSTRMASAFLQHLLRSPLFVGYATNLSSRANIPKLNRVQLLRFEFDLPPLDEQRRIAAILDQADAIRFKRCAAIKQLEELVQAVFRDMFGDIAFSKSGYQVRPLEDWIDPARPITYGILKPGPDIDGGIPYVRVADMKLGGIELEGVRRTTTEIANAYRRSQLLAGDLLVSIRGHVGRLAFVPSELAGGNITQDSARLAVAEPKSAVYVRAALETSHLQQWMARRTKGAAVRGINLGDLRKAPVPSPPLSEQAAFAERALAVTSLTAAARRQLQKSEEFVSSLRARAFSGQL